VESSVVSVTAATGYGKSYSISSYMRGTDRR
jgi:hypothetical protein